MGNGVLFVDTTGTGQLTQANQVIFTDWDPGATSDMQALEDVFDTNRDGSLDAGDADFANFFVMETNANGTQTAHSLASLGITSINLNANATNIALPDGSSINGETTYTTSSGATGTAATVTFAVDPYGHAVTTTTTVNADGSTTIANVAFNADGSIAYSHILNTSADGLSKTLTDLNSGGVVTTIQTDDTVVNADGSTTETLTNYAGGTIQTNGELTANGTAGSEKLNSTATTTSANGLVVTILRDQLGGGWTTQREVDTTNADGSTSIVVSNLNPDGSASNVTTTAVSANGLTRTVTSLVDGIAADSTTSVDAIVVNGSTRTETVTDSVGTTVTSLITTVSQTAANSVTRTTTSDLTDGTTLNLTSVAQTVTGSTGSTTTQTDTSANGTLLDQTVTANTPQSGGGLVTTVTTSELDGYGQLHQRRQRNDHDIERRRNRDHDGRRCQCQWHAAIGDHQQHQCRQPPRHGHDLRQWRWRGDAVADRHSDRQHDNGYRRKLERRWVAGRRNLDGNDRGGSIEDRFRRFNGRGHGERSDL